MKLKCNQYLTPVALYGFGRNGDPRPALFRGRLLFHPLFSQAGRLYAAAIQGAGGISPEKRFVSPDLLQCMLFAVPYFCMSDTRLYGDEENTERNKNPRCARPQPQKRGCKYSAPRHRRHRRRVGIGQIVAGARGALRRRVAALSGGVVHLYAPAHDAGSQGAGR